MREDTEIGVRWVYRQSVSQSRQISFVNYFHSSPCCFHKLLKGNTIRIKYLS